jgi:hypothetical protein
MASSSLARLLVAVVLLFTSSALLCADASVHDYAGERCAADGNAFVLHGGSEGVYASAKAAAFIRYVRMKPRQRINSALHCFLGDLGEGSRGCGCDADAMCLFLCRRVQLREGRLQKDA